MAINTSQSLQSTTQKYLEIFDISNDLLMMQDGTCSIILRTSAINFDLFSEEEQDATIYAYAALLNSLSFPIEIVIRSQKKDVSAYLDLLKNQETKAYTPLQKKQIRDYRAFVEQLVQERNVLDKKFYLIITASAIEMGLVTTSTFVPGVKATQKTAQVAFDKYAVIEKALTVLQPRRDHLMHQLARIGLYSEQLKTQEIIQLFYGIFNPEASEGQKIVNSADYTTPLVSAQLRVTPEAAPTPPVIPVEEDKTQTATTPAKPGSPPPAPATPAQPPASKLAPPPTVSPMTAPPAPSAPSNIPPSQPSIPQAPVTSALKEDSFIIGTDLKPPTPPAAQ